MATYNLAPPRPEAYGDTPSVQRAAAQLGGLNPTAALGMYLAAQGDRDAGVRQYNLASAAARQTAVQQAALDRSLKQQELQYDLRRALAANPGSAALVATPEMNLDPNIVRQQYDLGVNAQNASTFKDNASGIGSLSDAGWQVGGVDPSSGVVTGGTSFVGRPDITITGMNNATSLANNASTQAGADRRQNQRINTAQTAESRINQGAGTAYQRVYDSTYRAELSAAARELGVTIDGLPQDRRALAEATAQQRATQAANGYRSAAAGRIDPVGASLADPNDGAPEDMTMQPRSTPAPVQTSQRADPSTPVAPAPQARPMAAANTEANVRGQLAQAGVTNLQLQASASTGKRYLVGTDANGRRVVREVQ